MRPSIICHMITSLDGGLHPSRFTASPDGGRDQWVAAYERVQDTLGGDAWIVGRVTMAEMSKAVAHPPSDFGAVARPVHVADAKARRFGVVLDRSARLHFSGGTVMGSDHVVVLLGADTPDSHLAELSADGVSYIVAQDEDFALAPLLSTLSQHFGIRTLLLEGGAVTNGAFFAAGLVDELSLLVCPALDARREGERFIAFGETGLAGKVQLSLRSVETLATGLLHLRYAVIAS